MLIIKGLFIKYVEIAALKSFLYFVVITLGFHFFFRYWAAQMDYWPIKNTIVEIYGILSKIVFEQSAFIITFLLEDKVSLSDQEFIFTNNGSISIGSGCSGLKQILQFVVLFLFIRGPLLKKLWIIPLGVLAMHLTNLFRIISLSFIILFKPDYWQFSHDYLLRPLFYVVIFIFWVMWVEKLSSPQLKTNIKSE